MSTGTLKVLVLEDNPLIAMGMEDALLAESFEIAATLSSCDLALSWLATGNCDVALLDIHLRDGVSVDVAVALIARNISFVVHSVSSSNSPDIDPIFQQGVWVGKPSQDENLIAAVGEAMKARDLSSKGRSDREPSRFLSDSL